MLSAVPATSDGIFGCQFPTFFEGGFPPPWDSQELLPFLSQQNHEPLFSPIIPPQEPVSSNSGSVRDGLNATQKNINRKRKNPDSGSDDPTQVEERKQRRMISNRESARRSRMRKQKHLENLRNQVKRFKIGNRDMMNRLHTIIIHSRIVRMENERLEMESAILQQKLWDMHQIYVHANSNNN